MANSCSTMHKIAEKEFTLEDFSCEHLENSWLANLKETIKLLNEARGAYNWCNTDAKKVDSRICPKNLAIFSICSFFLDNLYIYLYASIPCLYLKVGLLDFQDSFLSILL